MLVVLLILRFLLLQLAIKMYSIFNYLLHPGFTRIPSIPQIHFNVYNDDTYVAKIPQQK